MNKLFELKFGSHLYGTATPKSDLDFKAVYLPNSRQIILNDYHKTVNMSRKKAHGERNSKDDIDIEIFSLDQFLKLFAEGQTMALDMIFAPDKMFTAKNPANWQYFQDIRDNKEKLISKNVNAFIGYARKQAAKYGVKGTRMDALRMSMDVFGMIPVYDRLYEHEEEIQTLLKTSKDLVNLEKTPLIELVMKPDTKGELNQPHLQICGRFIPMAIRAKDALDIVSRIYAEYGSRSRKANIAGGVDFKALSHAVRVNSEGLELLRTGNITFPRPDAELLIQIKTEQLPFEYVSELITSGLEELVEVEKTSTLRAEPDRDWAQDFLYDVYSNEVKRIK